jgi:hypothetical protein
MAAQLYSPDFDDFGPLEPHDAPFKAFSFAGVYAFFDKDGNCLYVGQSVSVPTRIRAHRKKPWYSKVVTRRVLRLKTDDDRLTREAVLILSNRPSNNRAIKIALRKDGGLYEIQFVRGKK